MQVSIENHSRYLSQGWVGGSGPWALQVMIRFWQACGGCVLHKVVLVFGRATTCHPSRRARSSFTRVGRDGWIRCFFSFSFFPFLFISGGSPYRLCRALLGLDPSFGRPCSRYLHTRPNVNQAPPLPRSIPIHVEVGMRAWCRPAIARAPRRARPSSSKRRNEVETRSRRACRRCLAVLTFSFADYDATRVGARRDDPYEDPCVLRILESLSPRWQASVVG